MKEIDNFLQHKSKNTKKNYRWILNEYFKEINANPEKYFNNPEHDYEQDVKDWWLGHINEVPTTRHTKLNAIRGLLEESDIIFPKKFWRKLRQMKKGTRPATMDRTPSHSEFKQILQHGTVKDKALFLFASSSGMRITEILHLKPSNVDLNHNPPMVTIPGNISKSGDPRTTFISPEAKEYLQIWYKERNSYIDTANRRTIKKYRGTRQEDTIFPFQYTVAYVRWKHLIKKAGLDQRDETTDRYVLHIHCLRKYFLSQLKLSIPATIAEALAGHEQYLDEAYRRYTQEQLGEFYLKGLKNLMVFDVEPDLTDIQQQIQEKDKQINELKQLTKAMELKLQIIENKLQIEQIKNGK